MSNEIKGPPANLQAEQSVLGALLRDNDAIDRVTDLRADHFYSQEHAKIFREVIKQISEGKRCDVITALAALQGQIPNIGEYLNSIVQSTPSAATVKRYADIVVDRAIKRGLLKVAGDLSVWASTPESADAIADRAATRIETLAQREVNEDPFHISDLLTEHSDVMTARVDGDESVAPIALGFTDLDKKLGGGLERGTLTIVAGRPSMGKTAFGLGAARNVAHAGVSLFLSMEMPRRQVMDRNVAALGKIDMAWMKEPGTDPAMWDRLTHAYTTAQNMRMYIDDTTSMNMLKIRAKARHVKRKAGSLDLLVIDQLSFITGSENDNYAYALGEYTRALVALSKDLDCAAMLLCQLNRKCEDRPNKRPMPADLAASGNIEQDGATILFIYRDEVYNPDTPDKGIAEIIIGKARQGSTGMVGLAYIGDQTRFESLVHGWTPAKVEYKRGGRGMAADL